MTPRNDYPGWSLDPDPLRPDEDQRVPRHDPPPARSFLGCRWWVALAVAIAIAILLVAAPRPAAELTPEARVSVLGDKPAPSFELGDTQQQAGVPLIRRSLPAVPTGASADRPVGAEGPSVGSNPTTGNDSESTPAPTPTPEPTGAVGTALIGGWASWYDVGPGLYAAAGPLLREALGPDWRGSEVLVVSDRAFVAVEIVDWCACGERRGMPTFIDLSREAFALLADPSEGIVPIEIEVME